MRFIGSEASIKEATLVLLDQRELEAVTVAEIREAAGVSNGSFFHHFPSKDALAGALYLDALRAYHERIEGVLVTGPPARVGVKAAIDAHLDWVATQRALSRLLFERERAQWMASIRDDQIAENRRFARSLDSWREELVATGQIVDVDVEMLIALIVGPAQIFCRGWLAGRTEDDPHERSASLVEAALRALGADDEGPGRRGSQRRARKR